MFFTTNYAKKNNFDGLENHVSYQIAINWMVNHTHFQHWPRRFQHFQRRSSLPPALPLEGSLGLSCLENKCAKCVEIRNHFFQLESLEISRCPNGFLKIIWKRCQKKTWVSKMIIRLNMSFFACHSVLFSLFDSPPGESQFPNVIHTPRWRGQVTHVQK